MKIKENKIVDSITVDELEICPYHIELHTRFTANSDTFQIRKLNINFIDSEILHYLAYPVYFTIYVDDLILVFRDYYSRYNKIHLGKSELRMMSMEIDPSSNSMLFDAELSVKHKPLNFNYFSPELQQYLAMKGWSPVKNPIGHYY